MYFEGMFRRYRKDLRAQIKTATQLKTSTIPKITHPWRGGPQKAALFLVNGNA
jgi:hypothetical protein